MLKGKQSCPERHHLVFTLNDQTSSLLTSAYWLVSKCFPPGIDSDPEDLTYRTTLNASSSQCACGGLKSTIRYSNKNPLFSHHFLSYAILTGSQEAPTGLTPNLIFRNSQFSFKNPRIFKERGNVCWLPGPISCTSTSALTSLSFLLPQDTS